MTSYNSDDTKMTDETKAIVSVAGIIAGFFLLLINSLTVASQLSLSKDHNLRISAMENGYTCNRITVVGTDYIQWFCERN